MTFLAHPGGYITGVTDAADEMVARVLGGENPGDIPIATAQNLNVYINSKTTKHLNLPLPKEILDQAIML